MQGIVATLNRLFAKVESSIDAHKSVISDAAHRLRNPAAAVQSLTDAARTDADRNARLEELSAAAHANTRVTEQLLSLERLQQPTARPETVDLTEIARNACTEVGATRLSRGIAFEFQADNGPVEVLADPVPVAEAIKNLIDNAEKHGGPGLGLVRVRVGHAAGFGMVTVYDDGRDLSARDEALAFSRFGQLYPSGGSGLGLAIAAAAAEHHDGRLRIDDVSHGASLSLLLPLAG